MLIDKSQRIKGKLRNEALMVLIFSSEEVPNPLSAGLVRVNELVTRYCNSRSGFRNEPDWD